MAPKPQAVVSLRKPVPPPIPTAAATSANGHTNGNGHSNGNGPSHADKFRAAMAHRKSYDA